MIPTLLLLLVAQVSPQTSWIGSVTAAIQPCAIVREHREYAARHHAGLLAEDELRSGTKGGGSFYLVDGPFVYLGPATTVSIEGTPANWILRVKQGEVRVTARGERPVVISTPTADAQMSQGILRARVTEQGTRVATESGLVTVRGKHGQTRNYQPNPAARQVAHHSQDQGAGAVELRRGQEMLVPATGPANVPVPFNTGGWTIEVRKIQIEGVAEASRRSQQEFAGRACGQPTENGEQAGQNQQSQQVEGKSLVSTGFSIASGGGSLGPGGGSGASGGINADAQQFTSQGQLTAPYGGLNIGDAFPGNINLITAESRYALGGVQLNAAEQANMFSSAQPAYFSIGLGALPTTQISTDALTGTGPVPNAVAIPKFDAYVVKLDQYGIPDGALDPSAGAANNIGIAGLTGTTPTSPSVNGATPLLDSRAQFNHTATFALGEFRLQTTSAPNSNLEFAVRRSDQDRLIVKDINGNDALDQVTVNPEVGAFDDVADPRFPVPTVKVPQPGSYNNTPTKFANLDNLRRAAATTVLANELFDYARRTGQTRFVVDGKIVDISGFKR